MIKYKFIGDYPETFVDLGRELQPEETVETENPIDHPRLQLVPEAKKTQKVEVNE